MKRESSKYFRLGIRRRRSCKKISGRWKRNEINHQSIFTKKCPWYYAFDSLYGDHTTVNPAGLVESDQPARRHGKEVRDKDYGGGDESEAGEVFSPIEISSGPDIQNAEDVEEDTESTHSSLHSAFSQIARDDRRNKRHKKRKSFNPQIKIENHQDKASSMEEETPKKMLILQRYFPDA